MEESYFTKPLSKRNLLRDEVKYVIEEAILSNKLKPGDRLVETRWAKDLGVSKAPVREAIRELEAIGLLENRPFQGTFVRRLTDNEIREAYKVRTALEVLALIDAAKCITEPELKQLREILDEMEEAADRVDYDSYIEKNVAFHGKIIEITGNKLLLRVWHQSNVAQWTRLVTRMSGKSLERLAIRHEKMYDALKAHNPDHAAQTIITHLKELVDEVETHSMSNW